MSIIIAQRGAGGQEPGIIEFQSLANLDQYRHRPFPAFLFNSTTVEALEFRDRTLFAADDQLLYEFPDARNLYRYIRRDFPDTVGDVVAVAFDQENHLWVIERGDGGATDQRIRFNDTTLADLTDFDRFTLNDTTRTYTGITVLDDEMWVVGYTRTDSLAARMLQWTGNYEGNPTGYNVATTVGIDFASGLTRMGDSLVVSDSGSRQIFVFDSPPTFTNPTIYGPLEAALFTQIDAIAFADLDPDVDTNVSPVPSNGSIPYTGRIRLTQPHSFGAGSPLGQMRRITNVRVGVHRSSGGIIKQSGEQRVGEEEVLITDAEAVRRSPNGYRVFTGEVTRQLHDLGTDPTATIQIEQGRELTTPETRGRVPHDLHITYIAMDIESED